MRWFWRGRKTGVSGENPRSTGEINYGNSTHVKYHTRLLYSGERHNALIACATRALMVFTSQQNREIILSKHPASFDLHEFSDNLSHIACAYFRTTVLFN